MTKEQFEENYCKNSNISLEMYKENFETIPCKCDSIECNGWHCISKRTLKFISDHTIIFNL